MTGPVPAEADRERLGAELAGEFSEWASREGLLARVTEEQCADLAKAYIAGAISAAVAAAPHIRSEAERDFLAASIAVWREIDRLDAKPDGYHPTRMSVDLRQVERAAWERYRETLSEEA